MVVYPNVEAKTVDPAHTEVITACNIITNEPYNRKSTVVIATVTTAENCSEPQLEAKTVDPAHTEVITACSITGNDHYSKL